MKKTNRQIDVSKLSSDVRALNPHLVSGSIKVNTGPFVAALKIAGSMVRCSKQPNKTESNFKLWMKAKFGDHELIFEGLKFRIAGNCYYCPDFIAMVGGKFYAFEVKGGGPIQDDSIVKFKAARERFSAVSFEMWQLKKGSWNQIY